MPRVENPGGDHTQFELLGIEGRDSGRRFRLDAREVPIGREAIPGAEQHTVLLSEPTVSAHQAVIRLTRAGPVIEHLPGATNPTLVNGRPVVRRRLDPGDRIQMGEAALELRPRSGATRQEGEAWAILHMQAGALVPEARRFRLRSERVTIGRSRDCDVAIPETRVSRLHARLVWRGEQLFLEHCSRTNATHLNGRPVLDAIAVLDGAEIRLSESVQLRLELLGSRSGAVRTVAVPTRREATANPGLLTSLNARIAHEQRLRDQLEQSQDEREREIDRQFGFTGTFLDIDVVDSYGMKERAARSDYIIVTFERFRRFLRGVVEEYDGEVLNSNGDELMCFFESPLQAVRAASAVVARLDAFNRAQNLLDSPFRVRQGAHTGHSLVDRKRGVAYSPILDVAGHLQKDAETNGLLISQQTLDALPDGLPFERMGTLKRECIQTHRMVARID